MQYSDCITVVTISCFSVMAARYESLVSFVSSVSGVLVSSSSDEEDGGGEKDDSAAATSSWNHFMCQILNMDKVLL